MIQPQTKLKVADNTGAKEIMCIRVLGGSFRRSGNIGDIIVASVKRQSQVGLLRREMLLRRLLFVQSKGFAVKMALIFVLMIMPQLLLIIKNNQRGLVFSGLLPENLEIRDI